MKEKVERLGRVGEKALLYNQWDSWIAKDLTLILYLYKVPKKNKGSNTLNFGYTTSKPIKNIITNITFQ